MSRHHLKSYLPSQNTLLPCREDRLRRIAEVTPWALQPDATQMQLTPQQEAKLPWGLVATADHWRRKPTRWLKGLDGIRDFAYGLYVHEDDTAKLLGPKWAGLPAKQVLGDPQYYKDVLEAGPLVGMTMMAIVSKPLNLNQARE